jgi:hypothetical protein
MPQCQGRRTTPKSEPLFFAECPRLHKKKPLSFLGVTRCPKIADDLCDTCLDRQRSTERQLEKRAGKYIPNQETMFHGRVTEPIPGWSRIFKGAWFEQQIAAGYTVSAETLEKVTRLAKTTYKSEAKSVKMKPKVEGAVLQIDLTPASPVKKKIQIKKSVSAPTIAVAQSPVARSPVANTPAASEATPKKKRILKPKTPVTPKPEVLGFVDPTASIEEPEVVRIPVKCVEIDGRSLYIEPTKDKVYDLKFAYLGRYNRKEDRIETGYADSDAE